MSFLPFQFNSLIVNIEEGNLLGSEDEEKLKVIDKVTKTFWVWVFRLEKNENIIFIDFL